MTKVKKQEHKLKNRVRKIEYDEKHSLPDRDADSKKHAKKSAKKQRREREEYRFEFDFDDKK